jgi:hypothetical protein
VGLDVWFKDDVRNMLLGMDVAAANLAANYSQTEARAYRAGFEAALVALAVSFGIRPCDVIVQAIDADYEWRALAPTADT